MGESQVLMVAVLVILLIINRVKVLLMIFVLTGPDGVNGVAVQLHVDQEKGKNHELASDKILQRVTTVLAILI